MRDVRCAGRPSPKSPQLPGSPVTFRESGKGLSAEYERRHKAIAIDTRMTTSANSIQASISRDDARPEQFARRARLVGAIAKGRQWLDDVISGRVATVQEICIREKCSVRKVNMTISLAFLAPNLVKAAIEGRLPRGIGVERLRDPPTE